MSVNPGPVPTEWQDVAGFDEAQSVARRDRPPTRSCAESLAAYERGARSLVPGTLMRWFMRATVAPRAVQLRVMERAYRPRSGG